MSAWFLRGVALAAAFALAGAAPAQTAASADYAQRFATQCASCHGEKGRSQMALTPSLAGQPSFYAITQLFLFREGRRENAAMSAVAKPLTDDDLRGFSDVIAALPPPEAPTDAGDAGRIQRGEALARQHRCASCHGADYAGGQQVARLAGQREDYLAKTLHEFRAGKRVGYTQAMSEALAGLSEGDLDDLAHYLAHRR
jgi:cytochrome c553